ncbi:hypothetical protein RSOL_407310 [Rhizoctonia solani AG-3 Rhs1AP]|uniref:Uncharacterized protein n=1 Tax=Rhizoctonia solani AG-3 Rhs1AP TaxID=1086054 RepID=X8JDK5_9AGAM|nr:hypothetical protein RSOL_407310 [Rhizoctonia solani AG-3 Rhs1AP]
MPVQFDPKIHLAYAPPESRIMMADLGKADEGIAPPFPLLSEEGVRAIREEIFSSHILDRCTHTTDLACQIRGMSCRPGFASFNEALWTHSETVRVVSEAAGIDLVPIIPYELGHVNVQLTFGAETLSKLGREPLRAKAPVVRSRERKSEGEVELLSPVSPEVKKAEPFVAEAGAPSLPEPEPEKDEHQPVVGWHRDSYPWVCVLMLSGATTMQGGETALACADGSVRKIRGPQMGWAIMLQGRYIDHAALSAYSAPERVTMVTSYRARDVMVADDSVLTTIRPMANLNELYYEWSTYRLDLLSERFRHQSKVLKKKREDGQGQWGEEIVKKDELKAWCREQIKYLQTTIDEMV